MRLINVILFTFFQNTTEATATWRQIFHYIWDCQSVTDTYSQAGDVVVFLR